MNCDKTVIKMTLFILLCVFVDLYARSEIPRENVIDETAIISICRNAFVESEEHISKCINSKKDYDHIEFCYKKFANDSPYHHIQKERYNKILTCINDNSLI